MIAHIYGEVSEKIDSSVIIDVNGVGYEILMPLGDIDELNLNETVKVYTYHLVREQSDELFGFMTLAAKRLFELLITVQGVGPRVALAILSVGKSEDVRMAIASGDSSYVAQAKGVGKKTAERVVVDLSDKVGLPIRSNINELGRAGGVRHSDEALEALMALGFSLQDATSALSEVSTDLSTSERITEALKRR